MAGSSKIAPRMKRSLEDGDGSMQVDSEESLASESSKRVRPNDENGSHSAANGTNGTPSRISKLAGVLFSCTEFSIAPERERGCTDHHSNGLCLQEYAVLSRDFLYSLSVSSLSTFRVSVNVC